jgi:hypothetical protein
MKIGSTDRKISWFNREVQQGALDLSPEFQRKAVWSDEQSSYLIDTILAGLPFPEIYVRSTTTGAGDTRYEVVDGQQRIRAILAFANNELALVGDDVAPKWLGKRITDLNETQKGGFWSYAVVVRDLEDASDVEIRDLFRRLNINQVVLTEQELRHARYTGQFIQLMEFLANDEWWVESRVVTVRQVRRMEDVDFISELFVGLMAGPQNKKDTLDDFYANYDSDFPESAKWSNLFRQTRALIESTLDLDEVRTWSGKSDFYSLFLAFADLARGSTKLTPTRKQRLASSLMEFRSKVDQAKKKDNTKVFPDAVRDYAEAVTRAASDAGRRATRITVLRALMTKALASRTA